MVANHLTFFILLKWRNFINYLEEILLFLIAASHTQVYE